MIILVDRLTIFADGIFCQPEKKDVFKLEVHCIIFIPISGTASRYPYDNQEAQKRGKVSGMDGGSRPESVRKDIQNIQPYPKS
ncbi:MAG: hypothetical protein GY786_18740 [Proteobacteria bacterium]|nr:hypothetical protein [Pseudomonadota bacterium]